MDKEIEKYDDETVEHRKRKEKTVKKSDHKHIYSKEVLFTRKETMPGRIYYGTICEICGKIGEEKLFETKETENKNCYAILTREEILEKYKGLPIVDRTDYN